MKMTRKSLHLILVLVIICTSFVSLSLPSSFPESKITISNTNDVYQNRYILIVEHPLGRHMTKITLFEMNQQIRYTICDGFTVIAETKEKANKLYDHFVNRERIESMDHKIIFSEQNKPFFKQTILFS